MCGIYATIGDKCSINGTKIFKDGFGTYPITSNIDSLSFSSISIGYIHHVCVGCSIKNYTKPFFTEKFGLLYLVSEGSTKDHANLKPLLTGIFEENKEFCFGSNIDPERLMLIYISVSKCETLREAFSCMTKQIEGSFSAILFTENSQEVLVFSRNKSLHVKKLSSKIPYTVIVSEKDMLNISDGPNIIPGTIQQGAVKTFPATG